MLLTSLGTRATIDARSRRHRWHSALLLASGATRIMIDCGLDWAGRLPRIAPDAIFVTHAHPDHAGGPKSGAECPVYATAEAWAALSDCPVADRRRLAPRQPVMLDATTFEAFPSCTRCVLRPSATASARITALCSTYRT